jgi:hypothetical protein
VLVVLFREGSSVPRVLGLSPCNFKKLMCHCMECVICAPRKRILIKCASTELRGYRHNQSDDDDDAWFDVDSVVVFVYALGLSISGPEWTEIKRRAYNELAGSQLYSVKPAPAQQEMHAALVVSVSDSSTNVAGQIVINPPASDDSQLVTLQRKLDAANNTLNDLRLNLRTKHQIIRRRSLGLDSLFCLSRFFFEPS